MSQKPAIIVSRANGDTGKCRIVVRSGGRSGPHCWARDHMRGSTDAAKRTRRRNWIVALSLPGYLALLTFALAAWLEASHLDPPEWLTLVVVAFGLLTVLSWALTPFFVLFDLVLLLRDPWRRERSRLERVGLTLLVLGSPVAWFLGNAINDAYHLLR